MVLDDAYYINSVGTRVELMKDGKRSNPRASKLFKYGTAEGAAVDTGKEFSFQVICTAYAKNGTSYTAAQCANNFIDNMMLDAQKEEYGELFVNGWRLSCRAVGIGGIYDEFYGVYTVSVSFSADSMLWTKSESFDNYISGAVLTVTKTSLIALSGKTKSGQSGVSVSIGDAYRFSLGESTFGTFSGDFSVNPIKKKIVGSSQNMINYMAWDSTPFAKIKPGSYTIVHNATKLSPYENRIYIELYTVRETPEWRNGNE